MRRCARSIAAPATTSSDPRTAASGSTGPVKASVSLGAAVDADSAGP